MKKMKKTIWASPKKEKPNVVNLTLGRHKSLKSLVVVIDSYLNDMALGSVNSFYFIVPCFQTCTFYTIRIVVVWIGLFFVV